jgi:hypothetical protein
MSTTYTWQINQMYTLQEPEPNYVVQVIWYVQGVSGGYGAGVGDITTLASSQSSTFIPYADLTEADVIGWVQSALGAAGVAEVEGKIQLSIDQQITPPTVVPQNTPLPWVQE